MAVKQYLVILIQGDVDETVVAGATTLDPLAETQCFLKRFHNNLTVVHGHSLVLQNAGNCSLF